MSSDREAAGFDHRYACSSLLLLPADVAEHIRMDVQTDIGHIVKMFAGNEPDDLADRTFGIMAGHASKSVWVNLFIFGQLRHIVQCCAFCIVKSGLVPYCSSASNLASLIDALIVGPSADIDAEKTHVDTRHLFTDKQGGLRRQQQLFIQLTDLRIEQAE
jgi:hypothetical protein